MRFLSLFVSVLAVSPYTISAASSSNNYLSTFNQAGGWGNVDASLEAGRYEPSSHKHVMAEPGAETPEFKYSPFNLEAGPSVWGQKSPAWATCGTGMSQSPVDIKAKPDTAGILQKLNPSYGDMINMGLNTGSLNLVNTGHALQINIPTGLTLTGGAVGNSPYTVQQMHMHGRSEHSISGARFPLELHIVHKDLQREAKDPMDPRLLSVVGIMVEESLNDIPNPALTPLVSLVMSANFSSPFVFRDHTAMVTMPFSLTNLLPKNMDFYHYNGSLTTPPCSEQVVWHVLTTPITASRAQILALTAPFGDVGNARPTQPLNTRQVIVSSFQTPAGNSNSASTISMTLAGIVSVIMTIVQMQ